METLSRNWWAIALRGVVGVLFGILAIVAPGVGLAFLLALFGAYALVDGILSIISGIRAMREGERWGTLIFVGIGGVIAGLIAWFLPGITALTLVFVIAFWAIVTGLLEMVAAVRLRKVIEGEWALGLGGLISVIFGLVLFVNPGAGALSLVWLIGLFAILFGILMLLLGLRLRRIQQHFREAPAR